METIINIFFGLVLLGVLWTVLLYALSFVFVLGAIVFAGLKACYDFIVGRN
jgi:hypothetical protein